MENERMLEKEKTVEAWEKSYKLSRPETGSGTCRGACAVRVGWAPKQRSSERTG